jgi:probable HAF family extracellular repeat protein
MKRAFTLALMLATALLTFEFSPAYAQATYTIKHLGPDADPPNVYIYYIMDLNDRGDVVGGAYASDGIWSWVLTSNGPFTRLPTLPNPPYGTSEAFAINNRRQVVGSSYEGGYVGYRPFLWERGQIRDLGSFPDAGTVYANDINTLGVVIGDVYLDQNRTPYVQFGSNYHTLETLGGNGYTSAYRVNELGVICGYSETPAGGAHAVIWDRHGHIHDLGVLPGGSSSDASGINDFGYVAVTTRFGQFSQMSLPAVWHDGQLNPLPLLHVGTNTGGAAISINDLGQIIGTEQNNDTGQSTPLIWQNGQVYDVNDLIRADDPLRASVQIQGLLFLNNRGQIVATGTDSRNYLLTPSGHL